VSGCSQKCACCQCCVTCSLGFFAPWHREQIHDKFTRRGSVSSSSGNTDNEADEDTKSVASMHELFASTSRPKASIFSAMFYHLAALLQGFTYGPALALYFQRSLLF